MGEMGVGTATIVLVHGAFADSSSWNGMLDPLAAGGHRVVAFAHPLRGPAHDAALLTDLLRTLDGPVVLVGHSYGGAVMTGVDAGAADVAALVFVAGFALEPGESVRDASTLAPGSTLAETLRRIPLSGGGTDLVIAPDRYHDQFCADLGADVAARMAVTQRPIAESALVEPHGDRALWRSVPSWFVFGELDRTIPAGAHRIMAARAGARRGIEIAGASHVVGLSYASETADLVLEAVAERGLQS
jgi:pimeloyl-ACP methyl ester carboxylesterase